jgi:thiol:disulfide interchange protein DsbA
MLAFALSAGVSAQLVAGKDYRLINPPQPTDSGKKVEVTEFFYYGCPHCFNLQPPLKAWLKRKPADVEFRRVAALFSDKAEDPWVPLTKTYYALEALGLLDPLHDKLFSAIHEQNAIDLRVLPRDPNPLFGWLARQGVDREKFISTYNSFGVQSRVRRSTALTNGHDITGTPALIVDGRYYLSSPTVNPNNTPNYQRYFQVLDQVIAMARKERAGKK